MKLPEQYRTAYSSGSCSTAFEGPKFGLNGDLIAYLHRSLYSASTRCSAEVVYHADAERE